MTERRPRQRSLQAKTLQAVALTVLALVVVLYIPLRAIVLGSFLKLEEQEVRRHVERARNALDGEVLALGRVARDYSAWDETYAFVEGRDPAYVQANYADSTFAENRLGLVAIFDRAGGVAFAKGFDLVAGRERAVAPAEVERLRADPVLLRHPGLDSAVIGIVRLPDVGPWIVASRPIVTSRLDGPIRGAMVMGRPLDAAETARLAAATQLSLGLEPADAPARSPADAEARASLSRESPVAVRPIDERTIAGHALLRDVDGDPALVLRVELPRDIYAEGKRGTLYLGLTLLAAGLACAGVISAELRRLVLKRLARLSTDVADVGERGDLSLRVTEAGTDELGRLGGSINGMLEALERLNRELRDERQKSERLLLNVLPQPIAERLKRGEATIADGFEEVCVLFADLVGFTDLAARTPATDLVRLLNDIFSAFDGIAERHGLEKIKTIGDAYMAVAGVPEARPGGGAAAVSAAAEVALDMQAWIAGANRDRGTALGVRVGIHVGPAVAGVIGARKFAYDLWGDTVNLASRMESHGAPGRVHVTAAVRDRVADRYDFEERGPIAVKGKGEVRTFWLTGRRAPHHGSE